MYKAFHSRGQQLRKKWIYFLHSTAVIAWTVIYSLVNRALKVFFSLHRVNLNIIIGKRFLCFSQVVFLRGSEWGYLINTSFFWLCNMKQLNFRHLTLTVKIIWNSKFFLERSKNGSKKANIILLFYFVRPFYDNTFQIPEDCGRFPKTNEEVELLPFFFLLT